jgi:MYXO-CTERM domain-containing protein
MKRQIARALMGLAVAGVLSTSRASAAWYEPFDYTPSASTSAPSLGNGSNQNAGSMDAFPGGGTGGSFWTAATNSNTGTANDTDVASGSLIYPGLPWIPTGNKAALQSTGADFDRIQVDQEYGTGSGGNTIFYSLLMRVSDMTGMISTTAGGGFFTGLQYYPLGTGAADNMSNSAASSAAPITIRRADALNINAGYEVGVAFRDAPNGNRIFSLTDYTTADTLFVVVKMEFGTIAVGSEDDKATLWVFRYDGTSADLIPVTEPGSFAAQSVNADDDVTLDYFSTANPLTTNIRSMIVRGGNGFIPNGLEVDEIRVGNSWAQVTPEPAGLGVLSVAAVGLLRRRRR